EYRGSRDGPGEPAGGPREPVPGHEAKPVRQVGIRLQAVAKDQSHRQAGDEMNREREPRGAAQLRPRAALHGKSRTVRSKPRLLHSDASSARLSQRSTGTSPPSVAPSESRWPAMTAAGITGIVCPELPATTQAWRRTGTPALEPEPSTPTAPQSCPREPKTPIAGASQPAQRSHWIARLLESHARADAAWLKTA